jgi:hypothetical protein
MTPPRIEMRAMLRKIAVTVIPHLSDEQKAFWFARKMSTESGRVVSAGTIIRWWNAQHDDEGGVDSRHMDWARARDRQICANDNARVMRPGSAEAVRLAA